jgi:2-dehydropantoate 2-reductase
MAVERSRVAVIGAGGVGGLLAAEAVAAGHDVTLCVRKATPRLMIETPEGKREIDVRIATEPAREKPVPWLLLATKAQDTAGAGQWLSHLIDGATIVVVPQNGIDHAERVQAFVDAARVLPALIFAAVERVAPGHIVHHVGNRIVVPAGELGARFASLLAGSHTDVVQEHDFASAAWRKLLQNAAANPITTLTLQRMHIMRDPDIRALTRALLTEAVEVARAAGARLTTADVDATLELYSGYRDDGGTSMLYDRLAGQKLEHEYITGVIVRTAERHGLDAPLNRAILALLRALDRGLQSDARRGSQS